MSYTDDFGGCVSRPSKVGQSHSYTVEETRTSSRLNAHILKSEICGEKLTNYTKPDWYYCIVEDGSVFKFHRKDMLFYELDLDELVWRFNQHYFSLYYDTYLRFQEFDGFVDYYPHADGHE